MRKVAPILILALALSGCPSGAYHSAVVAEHDFKTSVQAFQQAEMVEFQAGRIDATEHQKIEAGIERIGTAAQTLVGSLQAGAANTTVQQNFATLSQAVTDLLNNGVLGIKNPQSQLLVKTVLQTAQAILANVSILLAQPTTTTTGAKP
jgi:hypothetical protein